MVLVSLVPVIRIFDVPKAKEFYVGYLGFAWDWEHRFDERAPLWDPSGNRIRFIERKAG